MKGKDIGNRIADLLVSESRESRRPAGVEGAAQLDSPVLVEVMEQFRINAGPVVDRHGSLVRSQASFYQANPASK